jgi:hypothetical protein
MQKNPKGCPWIWGIFVGSLLGMLGASKTSPEQTGAGQCWLCSIKIHTPTSIYKAEFSFFFFFFF